MGSFSKIPPEKGKVQMVKSLLTKSKILVSNKNKNKS